MKFLKGILLSGIMSFAFGQAFAQEVFIPPKLSVASIYATFSTVTANTSNYICGGLNSSSQNSECLSSRDATFSQLYVRITTAPGAGFTETFELYVGDATPSFMAATGVKCTISDTAVVCNDVTHSVVIAAGQTWSVRATSPTGAAATSIGTYAFTAEYK